MSTPFITALIDTYNYGRYIGDAVESVLAQDFPRDEVEIVVVDDGSTDDTTRRVAQFGHRVRYFYKPNGGQASALNLGFAMARGEVVALLDADDWWAPTKIRRVAEAFDTHPRTGFVYHPQLQVRDGNVIGESLTPRISGFVPASGEKLLRYVGGPTSAIAFRRSVAAQLLPVPEELVIAADGYLVFLVIFLSEVVCLDECLTGFRIHDENLFNFSASDIPRIRKKLACCAALNDHLRRSVKRLGYDPVSPELSAYLRRHEMFTENIRFTIDGAGRRELFVQLRAEAKLYGPLWTRRYRAFKFASALAAFVLGYPAFVGVTTRYSAWSKMQRVREVLMPKMDRQRVGTEIA